MNKFYLKTNSRFFLCLSSVNNSNSVYFYIQEIYLKKKKKLCSHGRLIGIKFFMLSWRNKRGDYKPQTVKHDCFGRWFKLRLHN